MPTTTAVDLSGLELFAGCTAADLAVMTRAVTGVRRAREGAVLLDIARPGANEHVSFGGGSHFCLGNALARLEAQVALPRLVRRFPRLAPASEEPAWMRRVTLRGVETLPVTLR